MKKNRTITLLVLLVLAVLFVACKNEEQLAEKVVETEESSSQISDVQALESDLEEDEFEAYVKSTLNLSDNEIIEKTEWIEDQVCYRVAVERAIEVEGEYKHLSDYIFVKGDTFKCIKVTYPSKLETMDADRYVYDACDFAVSYEDITFDGQKDIVISLGHQGTSGTCVSCAYVFEENDYVYVKSFEGIPNYEINGEQKCIDGFYKDETYQYHYWNGEFVELK